jgi:hypothetical protein
MGLVADLPRGENATNEQFLDPDTLRLGGISLNEFIGIEQAETYFEPPRQTRPPQKKFLSKAEKAQKARKVRSDSSINSSLGNPGDLTEVKEGGKVESGGSNLPKAKRVRKRAKKRDVDETESSTSGRGGRVKLQVFYD